MLQTHIRTFSPELRGARGRSSTSSILRIFSVTFLYIISQSIIHLHIWVCIFCVHFCAVDPQNIPCIKIYPVKNIPVTNISIKKILYIYIIFPVILSPLTLYLYSLLLFILLKISHDINMQFLLINNINNSMFLAMYI